MNWSWEVVSGALFGFGVGVLITIRFVALPLYEEIRRLRQVHLSAPTSDT